MSTDWGYVCLSHDPPLETEHWLNHGEAKLRKLYELVRAGKWPMVPDLLYSEDQWEPAPLTVGGYDWTEPPRWLMFHAKCEIALRNEYGVTEPIVAAVGSQTEEP